MAQSLLSTENMFRQPNSSRPAVQKFESYWWCVSCLTQIALDTHGRCSACGSDAVDRIPNLKASGNRLPGSEARDRARFNLRLSALLPWR